MEEAKTNRDRQVALFDQGIVARSQLDSAEASYKVAVSRYEDAVEEVRNRQALVAQRRSELALARQQLADTAIPAPFDGAVQEKRASIGEYLGAGAPVASVVRMNPLRLRAAVAPGYALADRLEALRGATAAMNLPSTYTTTISGRGRELERTFVEFIWAFLLSVIFMYMILASQFESLVHPLTILLSLPLSVPFAFLSLWMFGNTLNLYSMLGILVLFGVVKKNSILQIDHTNNLRALGMERMNAILQANRARLRPILMTTLALVAGMLPLALGAGPGAEERRTIAVVVIGGQMLSLLLTLIVTPVAYSIFDDLGVTAVLRAPWKRLRWQREPMGSAKAGTIPEPTAAAHASLTAPSTHLKD